MYSLFGRCSDKKAFKETEISGVIASKLNWFTQRLFLLSQKIYSVSYLPFPFYVTNQKKKKKKKLKMFRNLVNKFAIEMY